MTRKEFLFSLFPAAAILACARQPSVADVRVSKIDRALEEIRTRYNLPGLAGTLVTSAGVGEVQAVGVRKAGTNVPVADSDMWHLGSDTKMMTATLVALLVEEGLLKWDTALGQIFPNLAFEKCPAARKISLLHLLSHRAGLPHDLEWRFYQASEKALGTQRRMAVADAFGKPLLNAPGTTFAYSNVGYVVAGAIIEKVTGTSWEEAMRGRIFKPLGMERVGFGGLGTPGEVDQPWPHGPNGKPMPSNGPNVDNAPVMGPAGTVHCAIEDWGKFLVDQLRGARGQAGLLKPKSYETLRTPPFGGDYGLGWAVCQREWSGGLTMTHDGSNTMNYSIVWLSPKKDLAALVCTNSGGPDVPKAVDEAIQVLLRTKVRIG